MTLRELSFKVMGGIFGTDNTMIFRWAASEENKHEITFIEDGRKYRLILMDEGETGDL